MAFDQCCRLENLFFSRQRKFGALQLFPFSFRSEKLLQVLRPLDAAGNIDLHANSRNFGTTALHGIVREIISKCFDGAVMSDQMGDGFVESVAKNNFEWYYVSKPHSKLPPADYRPLDSTIQGKSGGFFVAGKRCSRIHSFVTDLVDSGRVWFIQVTCDVRSVMRISCVD